MDTVECPRKSERRVGVIESFKLDQSCAFVRTGEDVFHVTLASRGVLQQDSKGISPCAYEERRKELAPGTVVVIDLVFDFEGKNPTPGSWAPKLRCKRGRQ
jgi:hypothetical protein